MTVPTAAATATPTANRDLVRRSMLCGPVNSETYVDSCRVSRADSVMLDLEDTVPGAEKDHARGLVRAAIATAGHGGSDVLVRINDRWEEAEEDLGACVYPGLVAVLCPKCESVDHLLRIDARLSELEPTRGISPGTVRMAIWVETVTGYFTMRDLARSTPRVVSIGLGGEDFAGDLGVQTTKDGQELQHAQREMVLVAREASVLATCGILGSLSAIGDYAQLQRAALWAYSLGYYGAACADEGQVPVMNKAFTPSDAAVERAQGVIAAHEDGLRQGSGHVQFAGGLVDKPVVDLARRLLARRDRIAAFEATKATKLVAIDA